MTRSTGIGRHPPSRKTHGESFINGRASPEYNAWSSMKSRCLNPNSGNWHLYGGRGIGIDAEWVASFAAFLRDMGHRPGRGYSLERRDNALGYGPSNCKWATSLEQSRNRRGVREVVVDGETMCLTAACKRLGISRSTGTRWVRAGKLEATRA